MSINPDARFKTAQEYIDAHPWVVGLDPEVRDALASIVIKRKGIWRVRREVPRDPAVRCAWEAYRTASHASRWGYMPDHRSHSMVGFFMGNPEQMERYSRLFDAFFKLARGSK